MKSVVVTGGAGFIGSALVRMLIRETGMSVANVDKLTYAGNLESLEEVSGDPRYRFFRADIADGPAMARILDEVKPSWIFHLAAESHVDRSIDGPAEFIRTNIVGTYELLEQSLRYWRGLSGPQKDDFRFIHVSTDEVFGSLGSAGLFSETTAYAPNSPYSASKAASDHLVRAWRHTYGLPTVITNCSNNYGPFQFPEKLIPVAILSALNGRRIPVYGRGENVRDWLFVDDHCAALLEVAAKGLPGETYNVGGSNEWRNIDVVKRICAIVDELAPDTRIGNRAELIEFVTDRPGHDLRYAIDSTKIRHELGWKPKESFDSGLTKTVQWYIANQAWCARASESRAVS